MEKDNITTDKKETLSTMDPNKMITLYPEQLGQAVAQLVQPIMSSIAKLLENNTSALEQISSLQAIQNEQIKALEKQIRLQTPVSSKQVSYLNNAIRSKARELLDRKGINDKKSITKLGNAIRKAVLSRYGLPNLREVPKHEYDVAMSQIKMWNDVLTVRDVVQDARKRMEAEN